MTASAGAAFPGASGSGEGEAWLTVIDMQRVFAESDSPWLAPRFAEVVSPIQQLASAFRPRVIFTRFLAPVVPEGAWREYYAQWPFALQPPEARIYELVDELAAQPGPPLDATTFSKWGPDLAARTDGAPLIMAGVSTDCCVLATALAAADAGTPVWVVADACAGATDESHAAALRILQLQSPLIEVVSLADALSVA